MSEVETALSRRRKRSVLVSLLVGAIVGLPAGALAASNYGNPINYTGGSVHYTGQASQNTYLSQPDQGRVKTTSHVAVSAGRLGASVTYRNSGGSNSTVCATSIAYSGTTTNSFSRGCSGNAAYPVYAYGQSSGWNSTTSTYVTVNVARTANLPPEG